MCPDNLLQITQLAVAAGHPSRGVTPTRLIVYPESIDLKGPRAEQRLGVLGEYADGRRRDLSRDATYASAVDKIAAEVSRVWGLPEVVTALRNVGAEPAPSTPDEFADYTRVERAKWGEVVKASGVQID